MKRTFQLAIGLFYLAALLFSFTVLLKPGAAVFYLKSQLDTQALTRDGNAFEYPFEVNSRIYNPGTILVLEDQQVLDPAAREYTVMEGVGTYSLEEIGKQQVTILFTPTTPSDPAANGHTYSIYIRPHLISSDWGGRVFLLLLLGLAAFIGSILLSRQKRAVLFGSPLGLVHCWFSLLDQPFLVFIKGEPNLPALSRKTLLKRSVVNIVLIAFFYVFMEWFFLVTRPSFMDILSLAEKFNIFMNTGLAAALLSLVALPVILLLDIILSPVFPSFRRYAYHLPPAFLGACISLILIDNFTYTVLKFGIVNSASLVRVLYAVLFVAIFIYIFRKMAVPSKLSQQPVPNKFNNISAAAVFSLSLILAGFTFRPENNALPLAGPTSSANHLPNIILFSTDGLDAASMSVYGYERDTTPFISELAKKSLVSQNNFTNASHSMGSDTALLTSKLPFDTRVLFPPDTLKGTDRFQHLPGILMRAGYRTVSLGVPYYVDVSTINFSNAFDAVNCKEVDADTLTSRLSGYGYDDAIYLLAIIEERITDRLEHIFFVQEMENPFTVVTQETSDWITDQQRLSCLRSYIQDASQTGQPLFAHVHLMATHGSKFTPAVQVFSQGKEQDQLWMTDFYDDTILDFDTEVQRLVSYLQDLSLYDNTVLVLYTDHGQKYIPDKRIPLIIHFPKDQHSGIVTVNTQNLDISPTILDYLGIEQPAWMDGSSLLGELDAARLILAGYARNIEEVNSGKFAISPEAFTPPFYQFGGMTVIQCQKVYVYNLVDMAVHEREVAGYLNPCSADLLDSRDAVRQEVGSLLEQFGFDLPDNW